MNRQITEVSTPEQKLAAVNATIASVHIEGFEISEPIRDLMQEYAEGKISMSELQDKGLLEVKTSINNPTTN